MSGPNLACLLSIKVSGSLLKTFLEQHYLKTVKLLSQWHKPSIKSEKREIRKRKGKGYQTDVKTF